MRARISAVIAALIVSSLSLFSNTAQAAVSPGVGIATSGLQMYWDAANINSYTGSGSTWSDLSGNGYTATIYNSPPYSHLAGGSSFTYTAASSQYAATTGSNNINFTGGISISFYANFGSTAENWERIIDFGNGELANNILIGREGATTNLWFEVHNAGSSKGVCKATGAIGVNTLDQYTLIVSADGTSCGFYKNGTYFATTVVSGTDFRPNSSITRTNNYIGRSNWAADSYFQGSIQEIAIYNRPLSGAEITQNYNSMVDVSWPTLSTGTFSMAENKTIVETLTASEPSTFSISTGSDSAKFSMTSSGVISFISAPNYELPTDSNTDNVYLLPIIVWDANGNYNSGTIYITVTNVAEVATLTFGSLSGNPYKGASVVITVTPSAGATAGKVTYLANGKRIPRCYKVNFTGSGISTCVWKPSNRGYQEITISFTPNGSEYSPTSLKKTFFVNQRTVNR